MKLDHERKKYKQLHTSALTGAVSGNMLGGHPLSQHSLLSTSLANKSLLDVLTSTPRRDSPQPMLAQVSSALIWRSFFAILILILRFASVLSTDYFQNV